MAATDAILKRGIRAFLESHSLSVTELPTSSVQTPDLLVEENGQPAALIEIKQKSHDPKELQAFLKQTEGGRIASRSRATGYRNVLDGIIGSGVKQLTTKDRSHALLHVLWIYCEGRDANLHDTRFRATLLGTQKLFSTEHSSLITCYYFWDSSFFKYRRDLDAVVTSKGTQAQMLLNEHAARFDRVRASGLARAFDSGVWYPAQYGIKDDGMICDFDGPRDNDEKMLAFLRAKYGFKHLQTMDMGLHEAMMDYPVDDDPPDDG